MEMFIHGVSGFSVCGFFEVCYYHRHFIVDWPDWLWWKNVYKMLLASRDLEKSETWLLPKSTCVLTGSHVSKQLAWLCFWAAQTYQWASPKEASFFPSVRRPSAGQVELDNQHTEGLPLASLLACLSWVELVTEALKIQHHGKYWMMYKSWTMAKTGLVVNIINEAYSLWC